MMSRQQRHHCCCINVGNGKKRVSKVRQLQRDGAPKVQAESGEDDVATEGLGPRWSQVLWRNLEDVLLLKYESAPSLEKKSCGKLTRE